MIKIHRCPAPLLSALLLLITIFTIAPSVAASPDYQSTVIVSPVGTSEPDNGAALLLGLSNIVDNFPPPSQENRYLLKIEPGVYDVGSVSIELPAYVDMEGSGEGVTLLRGNVTSSLAGALGVVTVRPKAGLRQLSVENYIDEEIEDSAAVVLVAGSKASFVTAISTGRSPISRALFVDGSIEDQPMAQASNVTAIAKTRAVQTFFPGLNADNLVAVGGTEAFFASSGNAFLRNSRLSGDEFSLLVTSLPDTVDLVSTQLDGEVSCNLRNCRCVASYDAFLNLAKPSCAIRNAKPRPRIQK